MTHTAHDAFKKIRQFAPDFRPKLAIVLGSGLGEFINQIENPSSIPYHQLAGFHQPKVEGHAGNLHLGYVKGVPVVCLQGRAHYYEGADNQAIKTMVRTMKLLGCDTWIATNAAGSLQEHIGPGSLVLVKDHINFQFTNVLMGPNDENFGPRFITLEDAYDPLLRTQFLKIAKQHEWSLTEGVYLGTLGPSFETPAEIKAYRTLGADLVGMSTIPEVIAARHCDMRVAVISVVTNFAAGMLREKISHQQTLLVAKQATHQLTELVLEFIAQT